MTDRPILFSVPMVRAILDGRKTQTRRLCAWANNPNSPVLTYIVACDEPGWFGDEEGEVQFKVGFAPGDRLWVRETWTARMSHGWTIADARSRMFDEEILYRADGTESIDGWWPSIHMPREFSRLTLLVSEVRVERLQDISEVDAIAEGLGEGDFGGMDPRCWYRDLWDNINGPGSWDANPWVIAITFEVAHRNIDRPAA